MNTPTQSDPVMEMARKVGMSILELAERCEGASKASEELDAEIFRALGWSETPNPTHAGGLVGRWRHIDGSVIGHGAPPRYTGSLDAAWSLVPTTGLAMTRELWDAGKKCGQAHINLYREGMWIGDASGLAATPALALTAACLRANHHLKGSDDV